MRILLVLSLIVGACYAQMASVPNALFNPIRLGGVGVLQNAVVTVQKAFNDSVQAFGPVNASCNAIVNTKIEKCKSCVTKKCEDRAKSACKPSEFELILAKGIGFFASDIPGFFSKTLPNFAVNEVGGFVINTGKDIGKFFKGGTSFPQKTNVIEPISSFNIHKTKALIIGPGLIDMKTKPQNQGGNAFFGKTFEKFNGVVDIGKEIGNGFKDLGSALGNFGKTIGGGFKDGFNGIVDIGEKIGKGFLTGVNEIGNFFGKLGGLIGRKRRDLEAHRAVRDLQRVMRNGEPGCDAIKNDAGTACQYYIVKCADCNIDKARDCPGYKDALTRVVKSNNDRAWLAKLKKSNYDITSIKYDATSFDPAALGYKTVSVSVNLFGNDLSFTMNKPINPFDAGTAGPAIATQALEALKKLP